ncbi:MAG: bifunctional pyr operon transcriptional regulator/uracil phosphoribosyltransferase [Candidatus Epulonipiscium fishelsonii]|nr:MAG: bifunctional pyr operon transcriptional regulator/uracil phosphoribosyltransferase [Epulopiscium sp. AS2M-Bin002]
MNRALTRISHEILESNKGAENLVLIGIETRGVPLAIKIAEKIKIIENVKVPVEKVNITYYRDDLVKKSENPIRGETHLEVDISNKKVILVDDVIFTGRTVRAAMDAIMDLGRPSCIQLATLIDRGHRELPIRPDYIGKNIPTAKTEIVHVRVKYADKVNQVVLETVNK